MTLASHSTPVSSHQEPSRGRIFGIDHELLKPGQKAASSDLGLDGRVRSNRGFAQDSTR